MRIKKSGFTLIELLVVIAIIALLLAVIMPALGAAKEQARSITCRAHVKQWATCYALYVQENDQLFPPHLIQKLFNRVSHKKKVMKVIPQADHLIFQENTEDALKICLKFINTYIKPKMRLQEDLSDE